MMKSLQAQCCIHGCQAWWVTSAIAFNRQRCIQGPSSMVGRFSNMPDGPWMQHCLLKAFKLAAHLYGWCLLETQK